MDNIEVGTDPETGASVALTLPGIAAHTAVFAQTGAGKSFLLGRYLEEILLKTRAKVVILDPNSDFLRFGEPSAAYGDKDFAGEWERLPLTLLSNRGNDILTLTASQAVHRVSIDWSSLSPSEQCRYLGFVTPLDYQEYITVVLTNRVAQSQNVKYTLNDFLSTLRMIRNRLKERDDAAKPAIPGLPEDIDGNLLPESSLLKVFTEAFKLAELEVWPATTETRSVDGVVEEFSSTSSDQRVLVLDLPSLDHDQAQAMLADRVLEVLWRSARSNWLDAVGRTPDDDPRVPTFVVIDEAHNLVPPETGGAIETSVKARLTKIAAEGRKYGLFLILVTQRPSRITYDILSQVENVFLLKVTNRIDLEFMQRTFGTLDPEAIMKAPSLGLGQFILSGRLVAKASVLKGLPRRTEEGGRSIRADVWIRPPGLPKSA